MTFDPRDALQKYLPPAVLVGISLFSCQSHIAREHAERPNEDLATPRQTINLGKIPVETAVKSLHGKRVEFDAKIAFDEIRAEGVDIGKFRRIPVYAFYVENPDFPNALTRIRGEAADLSTRLPTNGTYKVQGYFGLDRNDHRRPYLIDAKIVK